MTIWRCYAFYDVAGDALYVGQSRRSPYIRLVEHQIQPWILAEYHSHTVLPGVHYSQAEADAAEDGWITSLRPRFNVKGNEGNPDRVSPYTMRYEAGSRRGQPYRPDLYPQPFSWSPPSDQEPFRPAARSRGNMMYGRITKAREHAQAGRSAERLYGATRVVYADNAATPAYGARRIHSPSPARYKPVPIWARYFAGLIGWLGAASWFAVLMPPSGALGFGVYGRFLLALTIMALGVAYVMERRDRLWRMAGVAAVGVLVLWLVGAR